MKNIFRTASLILAMSLTASLFSCGDKNEEIKNNSPVVIDNASDAEKKTLRVATPYNDTELMDAVNKFNRQNPSCKAEIKSYYDMRDDDYRQALERMQIDIIAGDTPDIIYTEAPKMLSMINAGYMADLYPLMENADLIKKEDILPNVIEGLETDGKLSAIFTNFYIDTAVVKTKFIGEDSADWDIDRAIGFYDEIPENADYYLDESGSFWDKELSDYLLTGLNRECFDCKNRKIEISDDFRKAVGFIAEHGNPERKPKIRDNAFHMYDEAIISPVRISGFDCMITSQIYAYMGGEKVTFTGFPTSSHNGGIGRSFGMYGIMGNSQCKAEAWELLNLLFDYNSMAQDRFTFSILKDTLEKQKNDKDKYDSFAMRTPLCWGANGGAYIEDEDGISHPMDDMWEIDDETVNQVYDYIQNVKMDFFYDDEIDNIVQEEINEMLGGVRSPQECISMIENRIGIYINEKM